MKWHSYLSISTCFGRLCAHHLEKQLCLCDTWYLLFCVDDCLVCIPDSHPHRIIHTVWYAYRTVIHTESSTLSGMHTRQSSTHNHPHCLVCIPVIHTESSTRSGMHTRQSSIQNNKNQVSHKRSCFSRWWAQSRPKHVEIDKYKCTKNKLCTKLVLFTRLYRDVRSTKHKIYQSGNLCLTVW